MAEPLGRPGVTLRAVKLTRDEIHATHQMTVPDSQPATTRAGVDRNADDNTCALLDGTVMVKSRYSRRQYDRACNRILNV